ncbi:hypothetical protein [Phaeobacter gallaeciensis]|uniref:hypothetical protein n=1 Tax=Phaeobacter gallaeciensis TaxID=60890 RepID=UPI00237F60F0|nr:hypothetical protein [Phaeobacter gallaeciensis]MDE4096661.1 hypothetical protein [Phaeobacter gallaeciensis]MDE4105472.1 hypothetical protein [Phaeobacter gallaeciensis]MDE4109928.1 hypothetical protein [Phaeobacter gallaeciensis]MDE4114396.1 hypothetical protein [Phaeobacter gallaeciensis]MDE4118863.1 hypothetical protein [Phaeobacter gallaeciensis]
MNPVSITRDGKTCSGTYSIAKGILSVTYAGRTKRTQIGSTDALTLAEIVLGEMIDVRAV